MIFYQLYSLGYLNLEQIFITNLLLLLICRGIYIITYYINYYKDYTIPIGDEMKKKNPNLIERGIFVQEEKPEYCTEYMELIKKASKG